MFGRRGDLELWSLIAGLGGKDVVPEEIASEVEGIIKGRKSPGQRDGNMIWTGLLS